jgi:hypothetical protein
MFVFSGSLRKGIFLIVMTLSALFNARHAHGQSGIELENVRASVQFGEQVTFTATIRTSIPIQDVSIVILDESQGITHIESLDVQADGRTEYRYDTRRNDLRPFTFVTWNYRFTLPDGNTTHSEVFSIRYEDDRFDWQTLESGALRVNWYDGDSNFGKAALNSVHSGLNSVSRLMPVDLDQPIEIYIYANLQDLRGTLVPGSQGWIAGHADPSLGVVMVAIEPGPDQDITMQQRIPHELMHVMLYRAVGDGYRNIPAWLSEGTAVLAELVPNAEYERVLREAVARNDWIPLKTLCGPFPADAGRAFLAYAESRSFARYLHETYGSEGLLKLASSYAGGADCERGPELAFGVSLSKLEMDWHSSVVGQNAFVPALQNITPYLVLLCLILIIPMIGIIGTMRSKGIRHGPETHVKK